MSMSISRPNTPSLAGEWRTPHNDLQHQNVGGGHKAIHDDETAAKIGFGAAPIHGTVHWSQFTPLLLTAFGKGWFETGSISVHFKTPVTHLEPVKAFISVPTSKVVGEPQMVDIWMEHTDGRVVLEGTASVGLKKQDMSTMVQRKLKATKPVKGSLLFVRMPVGTKSLDVEKDVKISNDDDESSIISPLFPYTLKQKLEIITEHIPWFTKEGGISSPWGRAVLPPECWNAIMLGFIPPTNHIRWPTPSAAVDKPLMDAMGGRTPVGLFGGCEVIIHNGPIFVNEPYEITRELVGAGETPRTEFRWIRTELREQGGKKRLVAEMTLQEMMLKGSFEGYEELRKKSDLMAAAAAQSRAKL